MKFFGVYQITPPQVTAKGKIIAPAHTFTFSCLLYLHGLLFCVSQCRMLPRATSLKVKQDWCLMRMILTGSLSQSCHPHTDTFNTARHSSRSTQYQEDYQQPLTCSVCHIFAHTQTHTHSWRWHFSHAYRRPKARKAMHSSSVAVPWQT